MGKYTNLKAETVAADLRSSVSNFSKVKLVSFQ